MERLIKSQRIYRGRVVGLRVDTVALDNGVTAERETVEHSPAVVVVPVDSEENVLLVRQYRWPAGEYLLEAPAGSLEEGEEAEEAALREMEEETGYTAVKLVKLSSFWTTPGFTTELMHAYLATQLMPREARPEADEVIELVRVPLAQALAMVRRGEIRDAKSIAALLMTVDYLGAVVGRTW
ncbi:MAG: NUDIX hydrolase [Chloroflexi bacterium]|nr:NUDIX hydrolase [Chloroflexota bacterium]